MNDSRLAETRQKGRRLPPITVAGFYRSLLVVSAAAVLFWQAPQLQGNPFVLAFLIALNVCASLMPIDIYGNSKVSVGFVMTLAVIVTFGVPGAVLLGLVAALSHRLIVYRDIRISWQASLLIIVNCIAATAYTLVGDVDPQVVNFSLAGGIALATVSAYLVSACLISGNQLLSSDLGPREIWSRNSWLAPHYAAMGVVAFGLVAAYETLGIIGVLVFATPAVMMRFAMKQYVDKTAENVQKLHEQNTALRTANIQIQEVSDELRHSYDDTLEALVNALDARDQETKGHSIRVSHYMMDIARELGVKEDTKEWLDMQRGSLLHDVGKIGVSDNILLKPGKLTPDEWQLMRLHPEIGYNMLRQVKFLSGAAEIVFSHHERWDGAGYPRGLAQDDIPLGARIFAVVDTFDSMTSDRPYRKALSTLDAMNEILKYSGAQFDPLVVEAFLDIYETWVKEREEMQAISRFAA